MAKTNYSFEKRQRELAKKKKQEEKRQRKAADKGEKSDTAPNPETAAADTAATTAQVDATLP